jgi:hypothetical protein
LLDWAEIAVEVAGQKKRAGQNLKNAAGLIIKIVKDTEARRRLVRSEQEMTFKEQFRRREQAIVRQQEQAEEKALIAEYEQYRRRYSKQVIEEMSEARREALRKAVWIEFLPICASRKWTRWRSAKSHDVNRPRLSGGGYGAASSRPFSRLLRRKRSAKVITALSFASVDISERAA